MKSTKKNSAGKLMAIICAVAGICFIAVGIAVGIRMLRSNKSGDYLETFREEISSSPCVTLECSGDEESVLVESDVFSITSYFTGLDLVESEQKVTQWTYRVTFNSKPVVLGDDEVVVLVGEDSLSIDGHCYTASADGVSIAGVRDYLDMKYSYYKDLSLR